MKPPLVTVFARAPELGRVKTRLARSLGDGRAHELYRWLGDAVVRGLTDARAGYALRVAYTPADQEDRVRRWLGPAVALVPQASGDLGARMQHAVRAGLAEGHAGVILVGTDCLAVTPARVLRAVEALAVNDAVIGPARDGGYYLLGLARDAPVFDAMPWSTDVVADETRRRLRAAGRLWAELPVETDVDERGDLGSLVGAEGAPSWLGGVVREGL